MSSLSIGGIGIALTAIVAAVTAYKTHMENLRKEAEENAKAFTESGDVLDGYISRVTELKTAIDEGTLTESEAYEAKKELFEIQGKLNETYGDAAEGIDLVNGKLDEQIAKMGELAVLDAQRYLNENSALIATATREMTKTLGGEGSWLTEAGSYIGTFYDNMSDESERLKAILQKYSNIETDDMGDGSVRIRFVGDATQAKSVLNELMTDLRLANEEFSGSSNLFQDIFNGVSSVYDEADSIIEKYQQIYETALKAKMIEEASSRNQKTYGTEGTQQTAAKWLDDYTNAIQRYNEALASGDISKISEARSEFESLDAVIQGLLADGDGLGFFAPMFAEVRNALNESAIAAQNFRETMNRSREADYLRDSGMTPTQFSEAFVNGLKSDQTSRAVKGVLQAYAKQYGIEFGDLTLAQVESLANYLADIGVLIRDTTSEVTSTAIRSVKDASEKTLKAINGISGVQKLLASQDTGKSVSLNDLSSEEMKDYISAIEYVNGVYQLSAEKVGEIVKAKTEEQVAVNETNKAYAQQKYLQNAKQIEEYRKQLEEAKRANDGSADAIENNIAALLKENQSLSDECRQYDLMNAALIEMTSAYQNWINAKSAAQAGDMFDGALAAIQQIDDVLNNKDSDMYGRVGRTDYKAAVDFIVPDSVDAEDAAAVNAYMESIKDMFTFDKDGNRTGLNIENFIKKSLDAGLITINDAGTAYEIAGGKTMEDFANGLGLSLPLVRAMFGELEEFGAKFDWADEAQQTLGDLGVAAYEAAEGLRSIDQFKDLKIVMDVSDFDDATKACEALEATIKQMQDLKNPDLNPNIDPAQVQQANAIIEYCIAQKQLLSAPAVMSVDVSKVTSEIAPALELLQQFQNAQNELEMKAAVGADTSQAQSEIDSLVAEIQGLDPDIIAKLGIDPSSEESIKSYIQGLDASAIVAFGIDSSLVDAFEKADHSVRGVVNWYDNTANLSKSFSRVGYVYWKDANNPSGSSGNKANGSANAYGSAKLRGDWRTRGGKYLVGELGREIVVDPVTGRWYTVGDNGAEFVDLPDGAIVFNHIQSNALLKNGKVTGRGKSYVNGSALVTGSIPIGIGGGGGSQNPGYRPPSGGSGSSIENNYDKELETFDWIEIAIDRIQRVIEKLGKTAESVFKSLRTRMNATSDEISAVSQEIGIQQRAYDKYISAAEAVNLSGDLKQLVRNGAIDISQYDEDTQKLINDYKDLYEKALDCSGAIDDLHERLAELYKGRFDTIQKDYENRLALIEKSSSSYNRKIDMLEEQGYLQSATYYKELQNIERSNIATLNKELTDLQTAMAQAMASGEIEEGSEAWYEMKLSIEDVKASVEDAELALIKYNNTMRQISWDYFDYAQERVSQITSEADFLLSLLDDKNMYDENGNLSDNGTATVGLRAEKYGIYMAQADKYAEEIKRINKEIANDPNNTKLIKRRDELLASQRDAILAAKSEKEAMVSLVSEGINVELEAIKKLIDAYTDSLDSAKDLYEYQKKIADKTENITELEKQLAAYQNDMSEETRAKIQKIQVELKNARDDLKDTEYDRFVSDTKKTLDSLYSEYEEVLNSRFDDAIGTFEKLIDLVNENYFDINEYISKEAAAVGYAITEATNSIWGNGGGVNGLVSEYGSDITTKLTAVGQTVESIFGVLGEIARANGVSFTGAKSYSNGGLIDYTGVANVHGSTDNPELVLNPEETKNFLLLIDALRNMSGNTLIRSGSDTIGDAISRSVSRSTRLPNGNDGSNSCAIGEVNITIPIDHVDDYNDFVNQLKGDRQFEQMIQDMTIGRLAGKSSLSKNKYKW